MNPRQLFENFSSNASTLRTGGTRNPRVFASLLGPAVRGFVLGRGRAEDGVAMAGANTPRFSFAYAHDRPELAKLYEAAKQSQWDAATALDWSTEVDPYHPDRQLLFREILPLDQLPGFHDRPMKRQREQARDLLAWLLSQFLHGEQGALLAACQVTEAVGSNDAKLYGSTQVVDEGRHVEVFSRYLREKLQKLYRIDDNLYVLIDALMADGRWDMKFLGMQILVEGLALGAFGTMRGATDEPLLRELLKRVITDEARHVHFGVLALKEAFEQLSDRERREREDWAFEIVVLLRNRFLGHEFYEEHWAHALKRGEWDRIVEHSPFMDLFRQTMFRRVIPNLRRIGMLSARVRPHYDRLGLLAWENERAAPELTAQDLLDS